MTKEEKDVVLSLIEQSKQEVKEYKNWLSILEKAEKDKEAHDLDRFEAFKNKVYCRNMIVAIENQLKQYANIVSNMSKAV